MKKVEAWFAGDAEKIVLGRLKGCQEYRKLFEPQWVENKNVLGSKSGILDSERVNITYDSLLEGGPSTPDQTDSDIQMNYAFKFKRFIHSQLSANPPSSVVSPTSPDSDDAQKAEASDRVLQHAFREEDFQEIFDNMNDKMLTYGTGWIKTIFNPDAGELKFYDKSTRMIEMEGKIEVHSPPTEDVWIDPDAKQWKNVRYMFERHSLSYEAAMFQFPGKADEIQAHLERTERDRDNLETVRDLRDSYRFEPRINVYEYYEKALPTNGMAGRYVVTLDDGTFLTDMTDNPHCDGELPYHLMTYLDDIDSVYGKSIVEYCTRIQDILNGLDSAILANLQAHSNIQMAIPEAANIDDSMLTDAVLDIIQYSGNIPPQFISSPSMIPDIWKYRDSLITALQDLFGINDSMLGIQRREQSAASQQTSIESGTMIHRRVFKKYEKVVESVNQRYLGLAIKHWDDAQAISVVGKENALDVVQLRGTDLKGGVDVKVEYGTSLPLDPNMRRESIMLYKELFTNAGMSDKQILKHMRLNDLGGVMDRLEMAGDRQREIFEEIIAVYAKTKQIRDIAVNEFEEHQGRLDYAYDFVETSRFKNLPIEVKQAIWDHMKKREKLVGDEAPAAGGEIPGGPGVSGAITPELNLEQGGIV